MAELIGFVNGISTSVKLAWVGVLAWSAVQFIWYLRACTLSEATQTVSDNWSAGRQVLSLTVPPESLEPPRPHLFEPESAVSVTDVEADVPPASSSSSEAVEPRDGGPARKRTSRRRRASASASDGGVSDAELAADFGLGAPKAT